MFAAPAPVKITPEMAALFELKLQEAEVDEPVRAAAMSVLMQAEHDTFQQKVWFWRFRSPWSGRVRELQRTEKAARAVVSQLHKVHAAKLSEAKAALGLWSEMGMDESRALFWQSFEAGKVYGRRQTFWDMVMRAFSARDRNFVSLLIELIFTVAVNFTAGMFCSMFIFVFRLPWLLASYQPSWLSGLGYFVLAVIGALSTVGAFLVVLYGSCVTAAYGVVAIATNAARIEQERRQQPGYIQRPHNE